MTRNLLILCFLFGVSIPFFIFPNGMGAVLLGTVCSLGVIAIINRQAENRDFLLQIFLIALLLRVFIGSLIYYFGAGNFFGGDAVIYDELGNTVSRLWYGETSINQTLIDRASFNSGPGWGMKYVVGLIYFIFGKNMLAAQFFSSVVGAATAPAIFICSNKIFNNHRVAQISAIIVAIFPSLVLWSCQLLKDGYIIFLLVLIMIAVTQLNEEFNYLSLAVLIFSLFGVLSLRFYIFYMIAVAVVGSFLIGVNNSPQAIFRRIAAIAIVGVGLTYLGVSGNIVTELETYASLEKVQFSRQDLASAESGFGEDIDVSTIEGVITAIPIGFTYLMFAPFPWQVTNFRQSLALPEVFLWWACIPFLLSGLWYTIKNRLRSSIVILLFSIMLTVAYSIFQGNVGTAYRQRAQIQVFLFIFIAVGITLMWERKENRRRRR